MNDLVFVIDDPRGVSIRLGDAYAGWTVQNVAWQDVFNGGGAQSIPVDGFVLPPSSNPEAAFSSGLITASFAVDATGPDGQTVTLTSPVVDIQMSYGPGGRHNRLSVEAFPEDFLAETPTFNPVTVAFGNLETVTVSAKTSFAFKYVETQELNGTSARFDLSELGSAGVVSRHTEFDVMDEFAPADGIYAWSSRSTSFTAEGGVAGFEITYDDGVTQIDDYRDGLVSQSVTTDVLDAYSYDFRVRYYDEGSLIRRSTVLDDGVASTVEYDGNGAIQSIHIGDYADAHSFDHTLSLYNAGVIAQRTVVFDDDAWSITEHYDDGLLEHKHYEDLSDSFEWREKFVFYQSSHDDLGDGLPRSRSSYFDDGQLKFVRYGRDDAGESVVELTSRHDLEDAYAWHATETQYDAEGQRTDTLVTFDDGVLAQTTYTDGVRVTQSVTDDLDARAFTSILRLYDEGSLQTQTTTRDDGRVIEARYDATGATTSQRIVDGADSFVWADQTTTYSDGEIASRVRLYDNGMRRTDTFTDGERTLVERADLADVHRWHSIVDQYDAGALVTQTIVYDDDLIG